MSKEVVHQSEVDFCGCRPHGVYSGLITGGPLGRAQGWALGQAKAWPGKAKPQIEGRLEIVIPSGIPPAQVDGCRFVGL